MIQRYISDGACTVKEDGDICFHADHLAALAEREREMEVNISDLLTAKNDKIIALEAELKERDNQIRHLHTTTSTLKRENATLIADKNIWHNACNNLDEQVHFLTAEMERLRGRLNDIRVWCEGSTCEICGKKEMTETDCYDYVNDALKEATNEPR